jgi:hypothetical protein
MGDSLQNLQNMHQKLIRIRSYKEAVVRACGKDCTHLKSSPSDTSW